MNARELMTILISMEREGIVLSTVPVLVPAPDHSFYPAHSGGLETALWHKEAGWTEDWDKYNPETDACIFGDRKQVLIISAG